MEQIAGGIPKVFERPLGHGTGTAAQVLGWTQPNGLVTIDNYLLAVALDTGILGLAAFLAFFGASAFLGTKYALGTTHKNTEFQLLKPASICIAVFLIIKPVFAQDDNHPLLYMVVGMIAALVYRVKLASRQAS